jgi:hypothetical protein
VTDLKREYATWNQHSAADIKRAGKWYDAHKDHVDALMRGCHKSYPMSGSDISRPELWKAAAWNYYFGRG